MKLFEMVHLARTGRINIFKLERHKHLDFWYDKTDNDFKMRDGESIKNIPNLMTYVSKEYHNGGWYESPHPSPPKPKFSSYSASTSSTSTSSTSTSYTVY